MRALPGSTRRKTPGSSQRIFGLVIQIPCLSVFICGFVHTLVPAMRQVYSCVFCSDLGRELGIACLEGAEEGISDLLVIRRNFERRICKATLHSLELGEVIPALEIG